MLTFFRSWTQQLWSPLCSASPFWLSSHIAPSTYCIVGSILRCTCVGTSRKIFEMPQSFIEIGMTWCETSSNSRGVSSCSLWLRLAVGEWPRSERVSTPTKNEVVVSNMFICKRRVFSDPKPEKSNLFGEDFQLTNILGYLAQGHLPQAVGRRQGPATTLAGGVGRPKRPVPSTVPRPFDLVALCFHWVQWTCFGLDFGVAMGLAACFDQSWRVISSFMQNCVIT